MNTALFLGVYPGLTLDQLDFMIESVRSFVKEF